MPSARRGPGSTTPGPTSTPTAATAITHDDTAVEWRVEWRRAAWSPTTGTKSRRFARRHELDRWVNHRLLADDRPDLSPITDLRISWRHVSRWRTGRPPALCGRPTSAGPSCRTIVAEAGEACRWHRPGP